MLPSTTGRPAHTVLSEVLHNYMYIHDRTTITVGGKRTSV